MSPSSRGSSKQPVSRRLVSATGAIAGAVLAYQAVTIAPIVAESPDQGVRASAFVVRFLGFGLFEVSSAIVIALLGSGAICIGAIAGARLARVLLRPYAAVVLLGCCAVGFLVSYSEYQVKRDFILGGNFAPMSDETYVKLHAIKERTHVWGGGIAVSILACTLAFRDKRKGNASTGVSL